MRPIEVTLYNALVVFPAGRFRLRSDRYGLLNPLHNYPTQTNHVIGPFGGGLPKKLEVGEQFTVHLVPDHEFLAKGNYQRIGFTDTFGRSHWASRRTSLRRCPTFESSARGRARIGELRNEPPRSRSCITLPTHQQRNDIRPPAESEEMIVVNTVRMVAALLAAICWFMSARTKLTRVRAGLEELDKVTQLADDLQIMGKWNAAAAGFACVAAVAELLIAFG
jgi:hypothetical protein